MLGRATATSPAMALTANSARDSRSARAIGARGYATRRVRARYAGAKWGEFSGCRKLLMIATGLRASGRAAHTRCDGGATETVGRMTSPEGGSPYINRSELP